MFKVFRKWLISKDKTAIKEQASSLLKNEAFLVAIEMLGNNIANELFDSSPSDSKSREIAYLKFRLLEDLKYSLTKVYEDSLFEEEQRVEQQKKDEVI